MHLHCNTSSINLTSKFSRSDSRLITASRKLFLNFDVQNFDILLEDVVISESITSSFSHSLIFLKYWREHSYSKLDRLQQSTFKKNHRQSINSWEYWRTEAIFWVEQFSKNHRNHLRDDCEAKTYFWRAAADFWKTTWLLSASSVELTDPLYWKQWITWHKSKRNCASSVSKSELRYEISDANYFKCENDHYRTLLKSSIRDACLLRSSSRAKHTESLNSRIDENLLSSADLFDQESQTESVHQSSLEFESTTRFSLTSESFNEKCSIKHRDRLIQLLWSQLRRSQRLKAKQNSLRRSRRLKAKQKSIKS